MPVVYTDDIDRARPTSRYTDAGIDSTSDSDNGDSDDGAPNQRESVHSRSRTRSLSLISAQTRGLRSDGRSHIDSLRTGRVTADNDDVDANLARRGGRMSLTVDRKKREAAIGSLGFTDDDLGPVSGGALGHPTPSQLQLAAAPTDSPHRPRLSAGIANPSGGPTAASGISAAIAMRLLGALQKIRLERELDEMHLSISLKVTKTVVRIDQIGCPFVQVHAKHPPADGDLPCAGLRHDWVPLGPLPDKPAVTRFCLVTETFALQVHFVQVSSRSRGL